MKIRTGFVSNSSSSSYLVGIALIKDIAKFRKWLKVNKVPLDGIEISLSTTQEIIENPGDLSFSSKKKTVWIEGPWGDNAGEVSFDPKKNQHYFIFDLYNNEGDNYFWDGEEYDYSGVDEDFFEGYQGAIACELTEENGVGEKDLICGAGRIG